MIEEYPDLGIEGQSQDLDAERVRAAATPYGGELRPAAEPALRPPPTGDDRVNAALAGLNRLAGAPAEEHVAVLEEVHGQLRDILGEVNEGTP
jgi:hypothetical protein